MIIDKNKAVGVHYQLEVDGAKLDASGDQPLMYLHGHGMMIPGFEKQLEGLKEGDKYDFMVSAKDGYGDYNENAVSPIDKSIFIVDGTMSTDVFEGAQLRLTNQEGNPMVGTVKEIGDDTVTMDFNHELAGKDLHFTGSVASLREATEEEVTHGHIHGEGGHHH